MFRPAMAKTLGNIIWMLACGCGKYAVKLAEAFAGMHGRAVQVTTAPDDQRTHDPLR
jgi:hypothetical protein